MGHEMHQIPSARLRKIVEDVIGVWKANDFGTNDVKHDKFFFRPRLRML